MDPEATAPTTSTRRPLLLALLVVAALALTGLFFYFRQRAESRFVSGLVTNPAYNLLSTDHRTNLVFLGLGGESHVAGDLTDSIMFISLSHVNNSITLLSIPRDIWVTTMQAKINTAYHYGNDRREGGGRDLAKSAVSEITGQPIHYALALDFEGFVAAIDAVGGIDVDVERTFDDFEYPIPGKETAEPEGDRYEHLHFDQGLTHMDGELALKFARSRHAEGEEGTDFARQERQQKIILAFKDKLLASETLLNLQTIENIVNSFRSSIDTDIEDDEFGSFFRFFLAFEKSGQSIQSLSLDDFLSTPQNKSPYQGQWVLIPTNSWDEIHDHVAKNLAE